MSGGDSGGTGARKGGSKDKILTRHLDPTARKATQNRASAEPSATSSRSSIIPRSNRSDNLDPSPSSPSIARKTTSVESAKRPISSPLNQVTGNTSTSANFPVKSAAQFSAKRVNVSAKRTQPRELATKSTGSASKVVDPAPHISPSGQARESVQSTLSRPRQTPVCYWPPCIFISN